MNKENLEESAGAPLAFWNGLQKVAARWDPQGYLKLSYILKFG